MNPTEIVAPGADLDDFCVFSFELRLIAPQPTSGPGSDGSIFSIQNVVGFQNNGFGDPETDAECNNNLGSGAEGTANIPYECSLEVETQILLASDPTIDLTDVPVPVGTEVFDRAFVTALDGCGIPEGGTVTFRRYDDLTCTELAETDPNVPIDPITGTADSSPYTTTAADITSGVSFNATYNGDDPLYPNPVDSSGTFACEPLPVCGQDMVTQSDPSAPVIGGTSVTDTATITGSCSGGAQVPAPGGDVDFFLCGPGEVTAGGCVSGGTLISGNVGVLGGEATSASSSPTVPGKYCWRAEYSGDGFYAADDHTNGDIGVNGECFVVCGADMNTEASTNSQVLPGVPVTDDANVFELSGNPAECPDPNGVVNFSLCADTTEPFANPDCSTGGTPVSPSNVPLVSGTATSGAVNTSPSLANGNYCFRADYSGDTFYNDDTHTDLGPECFGVLAICGDGIVGNTTNANGQVETCDPPGSFPPDGAGNECRNDGSDDECTYCGDGFVQTTAGEQCDFNEPGAPANCTTECILRVCGDGIVDTDLGETCDTNPVAPIFGDPGDLRPCRAAGTPGECTYCGDDAGKLDICDPATDPLCPDGGIEECDDGNSNNTDACSNSCETVDCAVDIIKESSCDGGTTWGDGCSTFVENNVQVRYTYSNAAAADLFNCLITDTNKVITPDPGVPVTVPGQDIAASDQCSTLFAGGEPDTATITCECFEAGSGITVSDSDNSDFDCVDCAVEIIKESSCDGGANWGDGCSTLDDNNVQVRYTYNDLNSTGTLQNCVITDTNKVITPDPGDAVTVPGQGIAASDQCSTLFAGGEPDTATITCECADPAGGTPKTVSDSDNSDFDCVGCAVEIIKESSCDGGANWGDGCSTLDDNNVQVRYTYNDLNSTGTLQNCVITDTNKVITPDPGDAVTVPGQGIAADDLCSTLFAGGEPDTATITCECADPAGGTPTEVTDSDDSDFDCVDCEVEIIKESSCDGGATWGDGCSTFESSNVQVRYTYNDLNSTGTLQNCVITDTNKVITPDPGDAVTVPGQGIAADDLCSTLFAGGEPDTATITCECADPAGGLPKEVTDDDPSDYSCLGCAVELEKAFSCDGGVTFQSDGCTAPQGAEVQVQYTVTNVNDPSLILDDCTIGDTNLVIDGVIPGTPIGPIVLGNPEDLLLPPLICEAASHL
jgi:hypothetical protein